MLSIRQKPWKNWSETVVSYPESIYRPSNLDELIDIVTICRTTGKTCRIVGAGHSFTPLVATSEVLISIDGLSGIDRIDEKNKRITVWAGTNLKELGELLHEQGYAMENLGDIDAQSIAGAISTGTHGTGIGFGSISTQVTKLSVLTANGELMEISREENKGYFHAGGVSLGMLGIIVKVELQVMPVYQLISESQHMNLDDCLQNLDLLCTENRHFEFFWFPHTKKVQLKCLNLANELHPIKSKQNHFTKLVVENGAFKILSELCRIQPKFSKAISNISAWGIPNTTEAGYSNNLFSTPRLVKFYEMEYSIPAERMALAIKDIQYVLEKENFHVHFPIECRFVKADDIWLSPAYQRDSAFIAVHMYKGMPFQAYFDAVEEVFQHHGGRPHWGKMHTMTIEKLREAYPKFDDFLSVRKKLDQKGMFLNGYLRQLFGI